MSTNLISPFLLLLLLLIFLHQTHSAATLSPAAAPEPAGPPNIVSVLNKAGHFTKLIRLLKRTKMDDRIMSLLNNSDPITMFAPSDEAFAKLPSETIKSMTYQQRIQLLQFHVINNFLSYNDFQTVTNPLSTQAGDSKEYMYPLNITTVSGNQVNLTTGKVNASIANTVYSDDHHLLAVYEVDHVLLPLRFYVSPPPTPPSPPPPAPKPEKAAVAPVADKSAAVRGVSPASGAVWVVGYVIGVFLWG